MWIARDKNGNLNLFQTKPIRMCGYKWEEDVIYKHSIEIDNNLFPNLTWDDEPIEVDLIEHIHNREYAMLQYITEAYKIAKEGDNWLTNDATGQKFCYEIENAIKPIIDRIKKDIEIYKINKE